MREVSRFVLGIALLITGLVAPTRAQAPAQAAVKAAMPPAAKPAWTQGIRPLSRESYYHAIECGKLGGTQSPCVFYDADLC